ncbi:hypothetical protein [Desulfoluna spongiiphila]|uniref:Uncharacterized protein n=1 Tax=Desulfoluna spongiiphila TaxID=419481 RepID=A0A1G5DUH6_9BACT|nr:hypothetical protein [Desulfoluna spongiiphila]SCY18402.1 hypothetical protein SAMN05216233_1055 [Desulfoluna spongiiphila]
MKITLKNSLILLSIIFLISCQKPKNPQEIIGFNIPSSGWNTIIYINDDPIQRTNGDSIFSTFSTWLVSGENKISYHATKSQGTNLLPRNFDIIFIKQLLTGKQVKSEQVYGFSADHIAEFYTDRFTLNSNNANENALKQAESIKEFSDTDKNQIYILIEKYCALLRTKQTNQAFEFGEPLDPKYKNIKIKKLALKQLNEILSVDNYIVKLSTIDQLEFVVGKSVVLVFLKNPGPIYSRESIVFAGKNPESVNKTNNWNHGIFLDNAHFIKINGSWVMLRV